MAADASIHAQRVDREPPEEGRPQRRFHRGAGVAWGAVGVLCFSGTPAATRGAVPAFGALTLTFSRVLIAAGLGAITLASTRRLRFPGRNHLPALLLMGLGLAVGYPLFLAIAVSQVPATHGAIVIGLVPAATAVVAVLRTGERPRLQFWLGAAIGLAAVIAFSINVGGGALNAADVWLFAAVMSCAVGYVEGGRAARELGAVPALCWALILISPTLAVGLAVSTTSTHWVGAIGMGAWVGLLYAAVVSMFAGSLAWYRGLAAGGVARVGQLNLAQPLLAVVWSALFLHEHIGVAVPIAGIVVLLSMVLCVNARERTAQPLQADSQTEAH